MQQVVRDAFRNGVKWCFISLVPWTGLSLIGCLFLSNIIDTDKQILKPQTKPEIKDSEKDTEGSQSKLESA